MKRSRDVCWNRGDLCRNCGGAPGQLFMTDAAGSFPGATADAESTPTTGACRFADNQGTHVIDWRPRSLNFVSACAEDRTQAGSCTRTASPFAGALKAGSCMCAERIHLVAGFQWSLCRSYISLRCRCTSARYKADPATKSQICPEPVSHRRHAIPHSD